MAKKITRNQKIAIESASFENVDFKKCKDNDYVVIDGKNVEIIHKYALDMYDKHPMILPIKIVKNYLGV